MRKFWIATAAAVLALSLAGCKKTPEAPVTSLTFTSERPAGTRTG